MPPDLLGSGSRFEPARPPSHTPASGTATRPRRKTTRFGTNDRVGERGGAPPPERLRRASTAALPGSPSSSFVPSREPTPFPLQSFTHIAKTKDLLSRKNGTPALARRVLVFRKKTLQLQQGPGPCGWGTFQVGHPCGTMPGASARSRHNARAPAEGHTGLGRL